MWNEIIVFIVAVVSVWQGYVTGGVVTGMVAIVERMSDWKMPKWAYAGLYVGVFLLVSFFLAWREQYRLALSVPTLEAQLQERDKTISELKQKPMTLTVNPPPIVFPPQQAYITEVGRQLYLFKLNDHIQVNYTTGNLSQQIPALEVRGNSECVIVDAQPLGFGGASLVIAKEEEKAFAQFSKDFPDSPQLSRSDYGPNQTSFKTAFCPILTPELEQQIRLQKKAIFHPSNYFWRDAAGNHSTEVCQWLQPASFSPGNAEVWHNCNQHNGQKK